MMAATWALQKAEHGLRVAQTKLDVQKATRLHTEVRPLMQWASTNVLDNVIGSSSAFTQRLNNVYPG